MRLHSMQMFLLVTGFILSCNILWWRWAHVRVSAFPRARLLQRLVAIFTFMLLGYMLLFFVAPAYARRTHPWLPMPLLAFIYIWDLMVLPLTMIGIGASALVRWMRTRREEALPDDVEQPGLTRRQVLSATAVALPPLLAGGVTIRAMSQLGELRVRSIDIPVRDLPEPLNGLTIAHVSDTHIGRFTRTGALQRVIEMTNQLRADLIVFTGDLIDLSLADLPAGVDLINRLDPNLGIVMCEGNHDLIEDPDAFEQRAKAARLPILMDDTRLIDVRGAAVQFLGMRWGAPGGGRRRGSNDVVMRDSVARLISRREPGAFPILLAHHPHAFDPAIDANIPLTLSGHTHGGQIMLSERLGAGPVMFRYWSGLYRRGNASLVVSNGAGNWFPLRVKVPSEIVQITLRKS